MAKFISIGGPAQDAERQALKPLVDGLPDDYTVYGNARLVERAGGIYEVDAVVVAPHAVYVIEIKSYRGVISGNDNDWFIPEPIRSPLKLNRKTAQILATQLKNRSVQASLPCVEGFVYLSHATECRVVGPASAERIHTRRTILTALQDRASLWHRNGQRPPVDAHAAQVIADLLTGVDRGLPPPRRIREWTIEATLDTSERYTEHVATHELSKAIAVLRVYDLDPLADEAERKQLEDRFRWEAQVLRRIGEHPHVIHADAPFVDEARLVLPFEPFQGITPTTCIQLHGAKLTGASGLRTKVDLWKRIALAYVQRQGVKGSVVLLKKGAQNADYPTLNTLLRDVAYQGRTSALPRHWLADIERLPIPLPPRSLQESVRSRHQRALELMSQAHAEIESVVSALYTEIDHRVPTAASSDHAREVRRAALPNRWDVSSARRRALRGALSASANRRSLLEPTSPVSPSVRGLRDEETVVAIQAEDVNEATFLVEGAALRAVSDLSSRIHQRIQLGDGDQVAFVDDEVARGGHPILASAIFTVLRFSETPRVFAATLRHSLVRAQLQLLSSGSVQRFVNKRDLDELLVPVLGQIWREDFEARLTPAMQRRREVLMARAALIEAADDYVREGTQ